MSEILNTTSSTPSKIIPLFKADSKQALPIIIQRGPIEQKMRLILESIKDSKYPDTFDWAVYDRLAERFGEDQPRGGVVFKTTFKLVNHHSSCTRCHYAFEIDSYGRGCIHNCAFCYAQDQLTTYGYWNRPHPFPVDLSEVRKIMYTVFETTKASKWRSILEKRIPIRIGSMSDSFMWMDRKYGVTKELLKIFNFYKYPYIIFTRSDLVAQDEYMDLLDKTLTSVQLSISGNNEELTRKIEPGAPSVKKRLSAVKKLSENGFWTTVRINPLFPTHPDGYFTDRQSVISRFDGEQNVPSFNLFGWDFLDELKESKVPSLLAGFVRLSPQAINRMSDSTGTDLRSFFKPEVMAAKGDKHYSDSEIAYYYQRMSYEANKRGMRFNTCYIGNGIKDYFQYQDLWSNKRDCCDARGNVSAFQNSSQEISWTERAKHTLSPKGIAESEKLDTQFNRVSHENPISNGGSNLNSEIQV